MPSVTMKDIAKKLNISTVSVSKALNNKEGVGADLRQTILDTAAEMGYKLKKNIQSTKKSRLIGIVIAKHFLSPSPSFYWSLYEQVVQALRIRNYHSILEIVSLDENSGAPGFLSRDDLDAIVVVGYVGTTYMKKLEAYGIPLIMLDFFNEKIHGMGITPDNSNSTYQITNYLIESGHRKIGYVGNIMVMPQIMDRYLGYYRAMLLNHIELNKEWVLDDRDENMILYEEFALPQEMPTAFVCNSDQVAYRFVDYLIKKGYRVPEDVSVGGFYDYAYAQLCHPPLTTMHIDMPEMAEIAADVLYKRIELHTSPSNIIQVYGKIVKRDSVKSI